MTKQQVSQEELTLLSTSDKDIRGESEVFIFNREQFENRISSGDRWQQLIVGILYLEHVFDLLLKEALPNPDEIAFGRIGFAQRIDLTRAMGLIDKELSVAIKYASKLRNRVAHDLNFEIGEQEILDFSNCTPKYLRDIAVTEDSRPDGPLQFHEIIRVVIFQVEMIRQTHVANRRLGKKSEIRLRTTLDRTPGAVYVP